VRPLRLELEGFTAFRQHLSLDLSTLDLFAITGETGAGKSSLIDAICYALYGRVPRVANETKECISLGMGRMYVTLEFEAAGGEYRVFRETKRQGQPNVRLERCLSGDWQALAHGATEVTRRVEGVVGLTYDAFTRSVLLPQGQFQEFLSGSPDKRREVLEKLLRTDVYVRMQKRAGERANLKKAEVQQLQSLLDQVFGHATAENLADAEDKLSVVRRESEVLRTEAPLWNEAVQLTQASTALMKTAEKASTDYSATLGEVETARRSMAEAGSMLGELQAAVDRAQNLLDANAFDPDLLTLLTAGANLALAAESSRRKAAEASAAVASRDAGRRAAEKVEQDTATKLQAATRALDASQHALSQAQRRDLAATLQSGLAPGDSCPVCGGKIEALPSVPAPDLAAAGAAVAGNRQEYERATKAHLAAAQARAAAESAHQAADQNHAQREREAAVEQKELEDALPGLDDRSSATLQAALRLQREAREERQRIVRSMEEASAALSAKQASLEEARSRLSALESLLVLQTKALSEAQAAAAGAVEALRTFAQTRCLDTLTEAIDGGRPLEEVAQTELARVLHRDADIQKEVGRLETLVDTIKDNIEKAEEVSQTRVRVEKEQNVAQDLWQMLGALKFQAFVQAEALRLLAEQGSQRLQALSGGRYRLCISESGRDFAVVDQWNADDTRSVRTLSGGETFLASLSLALALAESMPTLAAGRSVALDAIFLDEGFGSLDPEALDRAAEALDSLRDGSRMVCVVTHLQDLAQRMPARIIVDKRESGSLARIAT
jgi:exonuclease SbcC